MAYQPNSVPYYSKGPLNLNPVVLPSTAKTVFTDTSNTVTVVPTVAVGAKVAVQKLVVRSVANLTAGRMVALLTNGTTTLQAKDVAHTSTTVSTTAGAADIDFGLTDTDPIFVEEGWSLIVGSAVAQAANAAVVTGRGRTF